MAIHQISPVPLTENFTTSDAAVIGYVQDPILLLRQMPRQMPYTRGRTLNRWSVNDHFNQSGAATKFFFESRVSPNLGIKCKQ